MTAVCRRDPPHHRGGIVVRINYALPLGTSAVAATEIIHRYVKLLQEAANAGQLHPELPTGVIMQGVGLV